MERCHSGCRDTSPRIGAYGDRRQEAPDKSIRDGAERQEGGLKDCKIQGNADGRHGRVRPGQSEAARRRRQGLEHAGEQGEQPWTGL